MPGILQGPGSFARWGYEKIHESDILYPSNYTSHKVENRGSIEESIRKTDLLKTRPIDSTWHEKMKPVRWLARVVAIAALPVLLAPVGIVYNTGGLLVDLSAAVVSRHSQQYRESAKGRVWAIVTDVTVILAITFVAFPYIMKPVNTAHAVQAFQAKFLAPIALSCMTLPTAASFLFCYRSERAAWMKSLTLKNDWGISGKSGELLHANHIRDVERPQNMDTGHFGKLHFDLCMDILVQIHTLQKMLPVHCQLRQHVPNFYTISRDLQVLMQHIQNPDVKSALQSRLDLLQITFEQKDRISAFLKECYEAQAVGDVKYKIPFGVKEEFIPVYFDRNAEIDESQSASTPEEKYDVRWRMLKIQYKDVFAAHPQWQNAWDVLECKQDAIEEDIKVAWRKRGLVLHPDKPTGSHEKFQLLGASKEAMEILRGKEVVEEVQLQD